MVVLAKGKKWKRTRESRSAIALVGAHQIPANAIVAQTRVLLALVDVVGAGSAAPARRTLAAKAHGQIDASAAVLTRALAGSVSFVGGARVHLAAAVVALLTGRATALKAAGQVYANVARWTGASGAFVHVILTTRTRETDWTLADKVSAGVSLTCGGHAPALVQAGLVGASVEGTLAYGAHEARRAEATESDVCVAGSSVVYVQGPRDHRIIG
jgi:hypothetical protein